MRANQSNLERSGCEELRSGCGELRSGCGELRSEGGEVRSGREEISNIPPISPQLTTPTQNPFYSRGELGEASDGHRGLLALLEALAQREALALALRLLGLRLPLPLRVLLGDGGGRLAQSEALSEVAEVELPHVEHALHRLAVRGVGAHVGLEGGGGGGVQVGRALDPLLQLPLQCQL
eukprot:scaffold53114_cov64-Phaeocystis_antarctica.AAC.2